MSKKKGRFKKPSVTKSRLKVEEIPNYDEMIPIFSLERVQNSKYCFSKLDQKKQAAFANSIFKRKSVTWREIQQIDKHSIGCEKIAKTSIKTGVPHFITDEIKDFLAFRFCNLMPMVGYRQKNVFFVLWFDHDFTLYNHG